MKASQERIGTAIIGTGLVAHTHAAALAANPRSRFESVCSRDLEKARSFAGRYGVRAYTDANELLRDPAVGAVCICTPHPSHADLAVMAARQGVHVLVEKPMAIRLDDCDRMIEAADQAGVKLGVISQRRLYEPVLARETGHRRGQDRAAHPGDSHRPWLAGPRVLCHGCLAGYLG